MKVGGLCGHGLEGHGDILALRRICASMITKVRCHNFIFTMHVTLTYLDILRQKKIIYIKTKYGHKIWQQLQAIIIDNLSNNKISFHFHLVHATHTFPTKNQNLRTGSH